MAPVHKLDSKLSEYTTDVDFQSWLQYSWLYTR